MSETIRKIMKNIRNGKEYKNGFLRVNYYNTDKDTFLVETLNNGTTSREELTAANVRRIINDTIHTYL